ncbi:MAG: alpha/beta fold hydrolase [Thermoflexales bacterium]
MRTVVITALGAVGLSWLAWSQRQVNHALPLTAALEGKLVRFRGKRAGDLAYYASQREIHSPPLLLLHSVNAAASSFEMKPIYDHFAPRRLVLALDLPGFGFSARGERNYTPALFRDAILDLLDQLDAGAVDAVALSLSAEFLALAAQQQPARFRRLVFLSPTGFSRRNDRPRYSPVLLRLLSAAPWRQALFDALTSQPSLWFFLTTSQRRPLRRELLNYAYRTSHQPGAPFAPFAFVAGKLFTPGIFRVYRALTQPTLVMYGQDPFIAYDRADELRCQGNWRIIALQGAGALVHWDDPCDVNAEIARWIEQP